jgi:hypothetical protein
MSKIIVKMTPMKTVQSQMLNNWKYICIFTILMSYYFHKLFGCTTTAKNSVAKSNPYLKGNFYGNMVVVR